MQLATYTNPLETAGPITLLKQRLARCTYTIDCWPESDNASHNELLLVFEDHSSWFSECKARLTRKWDPAAFRIVAADMPSATLLGNWIRRAQRGSKDATFTWHRGEIIRLLAPAVQQGEQVAAAGSEFKITRVRSMVLGDHAGEFSWLTPGGKPRSLQLAIQGVEVQAMELEPLAGGDAITLMAELPGKDHWHAAVLELKKQARGMAHEPELHACALERIEHLAQRVVRLRPCAVLTPELIGQRTFHGVAAHPDLGSQYGGGIVSTALAVAAASQELLLVRQRQFD
jgi:hypothetical protein